MTDERRPIRQTSGNLPEFQGALRELTHITPKLVNLPEFVEGPTRSSNGLRVWDSLLLAGSPFANQLRIVLHCCIDTAGYLSETKLSLPSLPYAMSGVVYNP